MNALHAENAAYGDDGGPIDDRQWLLIVSCAGIMVVSDISDHK